MRWTGTAIASRTGAIIFAAALLVSNQASAQSSGLPDLFGNIFSGPKPGTAQPQPAPGPDGAPQWSGEDGASGHPLMTAGAIRQAAANFQNCVASMWPDAARRNITRENFERFTADLQPDLRIMDLMDSQPEFTKAIWDYLDILVNDTGWPRAAKSSPNTSRNSTLRKRPMASTVTLSRRSGASNPTTRRRWAIAAC